MPVGAERNGRRRDRLPGILAGGKRAAALPGPRGRGLASGMPDLDAEFGRAVAAAMRHHARQGCLAVVRIDAEAAMRDAPSPLDTGRLDHDQRGPGIGQHAEMIEVPIGGDTVIGAVLAHRRDHDAVREFETGEPDRREQGTWHVTQGGWRGRRRVAASIEKGAAARQGGPSGALNAQSTADCSGEVAKRRSGGVAPRAAFRQRSSGGQSVLGRPIFCDLGGRWSNQRPSLGGTDGLAHGLKKSALR